MKKIKIEKLLLTHIHVHTRMLIMCLSVYWFTAGSVYFWGYRQSLATVAGFPATALLPSTTPVLYKHSWRIQLAIPQDGMLVLQSFSVSLAELVQMPGIPVAVAPGAPSLTEPGPCSRQYPP